MNTYLGRLIGATLVCGIYIYVVYNFIGVLGLVLSAPVIGLAFNRLVIDAAAELGWAAKVRMMEGMSGTHYQYQGFRLQVLEDEDGCRWVPLDDVRKIVGNLSSDHQLAHLYPSGVERMGKPEKAYLRDDALMTHLADAPSARSIKFKNWAERNIAFPARKIRKSRGKYLGEATAEKSES